jgi:membrane-associated phospholipid phosphatase
VTPSRWRTAVASLARPYRVTGSMVALVALIPFYILLPAYFPPDARYVPELALDRAIPLVPSWSLVYGALYLFLILLPVFIVRDEEGIRSTVRAYLLVWLTAYAFFFVIYPTEAPRPDRVTGRGFGAWGLRALYGADPPFNCFPSLHVAHSFVSALASHRVHRSIGIVAMGCATLVAVSTLFTKQHYVLDVVAGSVLALVAYRLFLRRDPGERIALDRRAAPALALLVSAIVLVFLAGFWLAYVWSGERYFEFGP